jgi:hypothetical protein
MKILASFIACEIALPQASPGLISLGAYQHQVDLFSSVATMVSATVLSFDE